MKKHHEMKCSEIYDDLFDYAEKILPHDKKEALEEHLKSCSKCLKLSQFLRDSYSRIEEEAQTGEDDFFYSRVMARIERKREKTNNAFSRLLPGLAAASVIIAAVAGGFNLGKLYSRDVTDYNALLNEEMRLFDELKQESIEYYFLTTDKNDNDKN